MGIFGKIKAVWDRMLGRKDIEQIYNVEYNRSPEMVTAIEKYKDMRSGL